MTKIRVPKYRNHILTAINAAKFCIDSFNRVDGNHNQQAALIFNAQAWELLAKGYLIRKKEKIYYKSNESITAESAMNKLLYVYTNTKFNTCTNSTNFRAYFVAEAHISLIFVENQSFLDFVQVLQPNYIVPSRHQLRDIIMQEGLEFKEKVYFFNS